MQIQHPPNIRYLFPHILLWWDCHDYEILSMDVSKKTYMLFVTKLHVDVTEYFSSQNIFICVSVR